MGAAKRTEGTSAKKGSGTSKTKKTKTGQAGAAGKKKKTAASTRKKSPKKKTAGRKKATLSTRIKPYLVGILLGVLLGAAVFGYLFVDISWTRKIETLAKNPTTRPETTRPQTTVPPPPRPEKEQEAASGRNQKRGNILYEESLRLEAQIKKLDQELFFAFRDLKVADEGVQFLKVTPKTEGEREWDHTLIAVQLPRGLDAGRASEGLEAGLKDLKLDEKVRLVPKKRKNGLRVEVYLGGLHTHSLNLALFEKKGAEKKGAGEPPKKTGARERPKVAIIIDDFGLSLEQGRCFLDLPFPVTVSVLPFLAHSAELSELAADKGLEVMLHMPMQPKDWPRVNPGPGVLLTSMSKEEIQAGFRAALDSLPGVVGVNNHMGSGFTDNRERTAWMLGVMAGKNLFFVDSRTTPKSTAYDQAVRMGLPAARRSIFIDNVQEAQAIRIQLHKLAAKARENGAAVGIGHVHPITCQVLKSEYNSLKSQVDLVTVAALLKTKREK